MNKSEYITFFIEGITNPKIVGGKAANIVKLFNSSIAIPSGCILTTHAYDYFIENSFFKNELIELLTKKYLPKEVLDLSQKIQALIEASEFPPDLRMEIQNAHEKLEQNFNYQGFLAVRSSATIEDAKLTSFAGQLESFLYNITVEDVLSSIKNCWKSLFSPQTLLYLLKINRNENNRNLTDIKVAVIIQELIEPEIGGVLFTANVLNNDLNQMIINSTWGSCETITANKINPDMIIVNKEDFKAIKTHVGKKEKIAVPSLNFQGSILKEMATKMREKCSLNEIQIRNLCKMGMELELNFNHPQDIEWAIKDGKIYVLQSRPITTLK